jgi:hypothetical protein
VRTGIRRLSDIRVIRHLEKIQRRKEAKSRTLQARRDYNRTARE